MNLSSSIFSALVYHDIFDYPLTLSEICNLLVQKEATEDLVMRELNKLVGQRKVGEAGGYYFLKNRKNVVRMRKLRVRYSRSKLKKASIFALLLKIIPTVKLVAISGALAMENSHKGDDIDLVIVAQKGRLWISRFFANLLLLPFKRDPAGQKIADRACLNMFLDESDLLIKDHNVYTAHEICQMRPLWDRNGTYQRFIRANSWIKQFLPNWQSSLESRDHRSEKRGLRTTNYLLSTAESFLKNFQLWYMKSKLTTEKVGKTQLFFHPKDTQDWVIVKYQKRLKNLNIANP